MACLENSYFQEIQDQDDQTPEIDKEISGAEETPICPVRRLLAYEVLEDPAELKALLQDQLEV